LIREHLGSIPRGTKRVVSPLGFDAGVPDSQERDAVEVVDL
jgi:hypothetical protein